MKKEHIKKILWWIFWGVEGLFGWALLVLLVAPRPYPFFPSDYPNPWALLGLMVFWGLMGGGFWVAGQEPEVLIREWIMTGRIEIVERSVRPFGYFTALVGGAWCIFFFEVLPDLLDFILNL